MRILASQRNFDLFLVAYIQNQNNVFLDKNRDNIEEATGQFRLIQEAYAVLIDPAARAR